MQRGAAAGFHIGGQLALKGAHAKGYCTHQHNGGQHKSLRLCKQTKGIPYNGKPQLLFYHIIYGQQHKQHQNGIRLPPGGAVHYNGGVKEICAGSKKGIFGIFPFAYAIEHNGYQNVADYCGGFKQQPCSRRGCA